MLANLDRGADAQMHGVHDGRFVREVKGMDGHLFLDRPGTTLPVILAIHTDGVNPNRTTHRWNSDSITIISVSNPALPMELMNQPEDRQPLAVIPDPGRTSGYTIISPHVL